MQHVLPCIAVVSSLGRLCLCMLCVCGSPVQECLLGMQFILQLLLVLVQAAALVLHQTQLPLQLPHNLPQLHAYAKQFTPL